MSVKVKTVECDDCGRTIMPNEQVYGNGGTYCADCYHEVSITDK